MKMMARGSGGIINVGSNGAFQPIAYNATYTATKAFVLLLSEAVAQEIKSSGVRLMIASLGPTATEFFTQRPTTVKLEKMDSPRASRAGRSMITYRGMSYRIRAVLALDQEPGSIASSHAN